MAVVGVGSDHSRSASRMNNAVFSVSAGSSRTAPAAGLAAASKMRDVESSARAKEADRSATVLNGGVPSVLVRHNRRVSNSPFQGTVVEADGGKAKAASIGGGITTTHDALGRTQTRSR